MVVLEGANATIPMLTIGNNQYLQPDYMSPGNPAVLDSKKSPLALLAQTCSQIGADSNNVKSLVTPPTSTASVTAAAAASGDKGKKMDSAQALTKQPTAVQQKIEKNNDLVFKPYEVNVLSRKSLNGDDGHRPLSKTSSVDDNLSDESNKSMKKEINYNNSRVSSRNSNRESPASVNSSHNNNNLDHKNNNNVENDNEKSQSKSPSSMSQKESPRSSLEMLQSHHQQQQKEMGLYKGFNPFYDPTNPAFRSSFTSALSQHHASMLAAAASGYPTNSSNPYLSYARIKTPTGGEALVPVCKDPYCNGCQYSAHNQQMLMGVPCPAGCQQCEQQKYGLAMAAMSSLPPNHPFAQMSKPFACNWLLHDGYCGRRFSTTDELIQHMKTHSPNLSDPATAASILAAQQSAAALMPPLFFPPRTAYPASTSPLSPLSASRYHPYAKPGAMPTTAASAYSSFNPALSAYYPPYSWMTPSQRLGAAAAAAHP